MHSSCLEWNAGNFVGPWCSCKWLFCVYTGNFLGTAQTVFAPTLLSTFWCCLIMNQVTACICHLQKQKRMPKSQKESQVGQSTGHRAVTKIYVSPQWLYFTSFLNFPLRSLQTCGQCLTKKAPIPSDKNLEFLLCDEDTVRVEALTFAIFPIETKYRK